MAPTDLLVPAALQKCLRGNLKTLSARLVAASSAGRLVCCMSSAAACARRAIHELTGFRAPVQQTQGVVVVFPVLQDAGAAATAKSPAARTSASASLAVAVAVAPQQLQEPPLEQAATPSEPPVERAGLTKRQTRSEAKASPAASGKNGVRNGKGTKSKATPNSERRPVARRKA